jgi:hypothetical protein
MPGTSAHAAVRGFLASYFPDAKRLKMMRARLAAPASVR